MTQAVRRQMNEALVSTQVDASRFAEADANGDLQLEWEEFLNLQPQHVREKHSHEEIRSWFAAADVNKNGTVSINELCVCQIQTRVPLSHFEPPSAASR